MKTLGNPQSFTTTFEIEQAIGWELYKTTLTEELLDRAAADPACPSQIKDSANTGEIAVEATNLFQIVRALPEPTVRIVAHPGHRLEVSSGRAQFTDAAGRELDQLVAKLKADNQPVFVEIQGHTDATGSDAGNQQLGLQRAEAVRLHLARAGLPLARMATISYGESAPLADNNSREGRSINRRVQLIVMR